MAIPLTLAKRFLRLSNGAYKNFKPEFFGDSDRIEFPLEPAPALVNEHLNNSYTYRDICGALTRYGYEVSDYVGGWATTAGTKQPIKLGKILQGLELDDMLESFKVDEARAFANLKIIVSRHPIDVAGMSTGRDWTSCMTFNPNQDGCNKRFVKNDVLGGTLIAYLVSKSDSNINSPLARRLLKRFEDNSGNAYYDVAERNYGISNAFFYEQLKDICATQLNKDCPPSLYRYDDEFYYNDGEGGREIDTRTKEDISKKMQREILARKKKVAAAFKEISKLYNDTIREHVLGATVFNDIIVFGKMLVASGKITNNQWREFKNTRTRIMDECKEAYVRFIFNCINSTDATNEEKAYVFWKYADDTNYTIESWTETFKLMHKLGGHYYNIRYIDKGLYFNDTDKVGRFDFGPIYDIMEETISSPIIKDCTRENIANVTNYGFEHVHTHTQSYRHLGYERALTEISDPYLRGKFCNSYTQYKSSIMRDALRDKTLDKSEHDIINDINRYSRDYY